MSNFFSRFVCVRLVLAAALTVCCSVSAEAISADDFLPPAQAEPAQAAELLKIQEPDAVKTEVDENIGVEVTSASTLQDAVNAIAMRKKQGCQIVQISADGGVTFVATGQEVYDTSLKNVNAVRIAHRNAYVRAFEKAKSEMSKTVGGMVNKGITNFGESMDTTDTANASVMNVETNSSESLEQSMRKVLKGYVTYAVFDDDGKVTVTIVSSPKTRGKFSRSGANGISAASLRDGLNSLIAEVKKGLVPPVGGRVIDVPGSNEVAFVGFGSAIVRYSSNKAMQERMKLQAEQMAGARAADALTGIILGDDTMWELKSDESTREMMKEYENASADDPTVQGTEEEKRAYDERINSFRNAMKTVTNQQSLRQGVLPPGVMRDTDLSDDEYFAYGIAVYVPSISREVMEAEREMDEAQIVHTPMDSRKAADQEKAPEGKKGRTGIVQQSL